MGKIGRIAVFLGCFVLVVAAAWFLGQRSSSHSALQRLKAELKAKGEPLTFEELTRSMAKGSTGSCDALTNAVARIGPQRLGPFIQPMKYLRPGQALPAWRDDAPDFGAPGGTWEAFSAQLPDLERALAEIRQTLKDPAPCTRLPTVSNLWKGPYPNFIPFRTAAQWLTGAAQADLRQGRLEAGLQNIEAIAGLARVDRDQFMVAAQMTRNMIGGYGLATTWDALQAPGWTEPQLERLQKAWEAVNLADVAEKGLLGARVCSSELWRQLRQPQGRKEWRRIGASASGKKTLEAMLSDYVMFPVYKLACISGDELFYQQYMKDAIAAARMPNQHRPWPETQALLTGMDTKLDQITTSPHRYYHYLSRLCIPASGVKTSVQNETLRRLSIAAIALKRFQLRHGHLPDKLDGLVPKFLTAVPEDPMSGKALCYRLDAKLGFVLYSVGEDGKDDGGDPQPRSGTNYGLWEGRDAVWPAAAKKP